MIEVKKVYKILLLYLQASQTKNLKKLVSKNVLPTFVSLSVSDLIHRNEKGTEVKFLDSTRCCKHQSGFKTGKFLSNNVTFRTRRLGRQIKMV
jgi:hypothetical protein